jgi:hypothetical protein
MISGNDIGQQLAFELSDLVLERQLALFQALNLQLVKWPRFDQVFDNIVQIAVFQLQVVQLFLECVGIGVVHGAQWIRLYE